MALVGWLVQLLITDIIMNEFCYDYISLSDFLLSLIYIFISAFVDFDDKCLSVGIVPVLLLDFRLSLIYNFISASVDSNDKCLNVVIVSVLCSQCFVVGV